MLEAVGYVLMRFANFTTIMVALQCVIGGVCFGFGRKAMDIRLFAGAILAVAGLLIAGLGSAKMYEIAGSVPSDSLLQPANLVVAVLVFPLVLFGFWIGIRTFHSLLKNDLIHDGRG